MNIREIHVKNFRSLSDITVQIKDNLMCIVGKNDVGKSTVLKAIETFFQKRKVTINDFPFNSSDDTEINICIEFELKNQSLLENYNIGSSITIKHVYNKDSFNNPTIEVLLPFNDNEYENLDSYQTIKNAAGKLGVEFPRKKPTDADEVEELTCKVYRRIEELKGENIWSLVNTDEWKYISSYLPEFILIPAAQDPENEQKMSTDSSAFGSLFRVGIRKLLDYDEEGKEALNVIQHKVEQINQDIISMVEERLKEHNNGVKLSQQSSLLDVTKGFNFTMLVEDEHNVRTALSQRGNGLQRSVLIAIIRAQSDIHKKIAYIENQLEDGSTEEKINTTYFYAIEEPEAFLHLSAQRELYYSIKNLLSDGSQAIITTHSTLFIDEGDYEQIALLSRHNGETLVSQSNDIEDIEESIGEVIKISELMTGKVCCLVEGIADKKILTEWMKTLGYNPREQGIYFVEMRGCKNAEYYANVKVIKDFRVNFKVILDTDKHSEHNAEELKKVLISEYRVPDFAVSILKKGEIENYVPIPIVEEVLKYPSGTIDKDLFDKDPKDAMNVAKNTLHGNGDLTAKRYNEARDSEKFAKRMKKEDIDEEIIDIIVSLVKAAGGEITE